jgi:flavin-dependent dehydrogenase
MIPVSFSPPSTPVQHCDVLVIGGGPGGSTIAALLAAQGRDVVLLEKSQHPRFHIGESLLPANVELFEKLGLREQVDAIGMAKWGIEFVSPQHAHSSLIEFSQAWDKTAPMAWQVRRSQLDELLFRHAAASGASTLQRCQVRKVEFDADGADVLALHEGQACQWRARYVVDASGRDTVLASQFGDKHKNPHHNSAALFGHYTGAERLPGPKLEGNISIFWFDHGWFWFIPLADGTTSVGAVCWPYYLKSRDKSLQDFFADTIRMSPPLAERLKNATLVDNKVHATGNYAYSARRATGERWLLLGDAFAFVDPVFSSGVYLAMSNAFAATELVNATLDRPQARVALLRLRRRYQAHAMRGPRQFSWFIFRMTNPAMRHLFMNPANVLRTQEAVLAVLAGDVYGKSPIAVPLAFFKFVYYALTFKNWRRSWQAWRTRRRNLRDSGPLRGENVMESNA